MIAMAVIASTTATARGTMHGSCLPLMDIAVSFISWRSMVCCSFDMDGVGLNATLNVKGIPSLMPPHTPPMLLLDADIFPSIIQSVFAENVVAVVFIISIVLSCILPENMDIEKIKE